MGKGKEMITLRELKEKAVSKQQQKLMGLALAYKRGEVEDSKVSDTVKDLSKSMSTKELEDFASTKHKGLPQKKEDNNISNRSAALKPQTYNDPTTGRKKVRMVPSKSNIVKTNDRVDEEMDPTKHVSKKGDMYCVYNKAGKEVAKFNDEKKANAYARKNHDKLMEYLEVGTDKIRKNYASMTPGQTNELTGTDKALAVGAVGALAYGAKKAKDRFDPVKVRDARKKRAEQEKNKRDAEREIRRQKSQSSKEREQRTKAKIRLARMRRNG